MLWGCRHWWGISLHLWDERSSKGRKHAVGFSCLFLGLNTQSSVIIALLHTSKIRCCGLFDPFGIGVEGILELLSVWGKLIHTSGLCLLFGLLSSPCGIIFCLLRSNLKIGHSSAQVIGSRRVWVWLIRWVVLHYLFGRSRLILRNLFSSDFVRWICLIKRNILSNTSQFKPVKICCSCVISLLYTFLIKVIILEKLLEFLISSKGHKLQFLLAPCVHWKGSDERYVDTHRSVKGSAVHADKSSIIHWGPLWLSLTAVEAALVINLKLELLED